ncbi:metallo-beta-lactamase superfamily Hydrolase [Thecamonas trahens ATCC 50062]|uniref:Metallo-beta-lactamase superfamily Hydrolase n=1 Tax=Thecamonas trahens ATCC 50062 TaxID=461836 RepID=A0A0L0DMJ8_THETB|nr:metallo-beta-lactamase superfamily Hydrolase [Thecamonas trahens ATCC 50062]KNC52608.1 metallo-beta-lactamase superfamily Hydrolase [Thecamonas trahens ATCC 50062]|eukprot:XP_013755167.1 metallo-beta-lactamase superfamily Hydrolase [Thecamonas trahens ATCC 50062]
MSAGRFTGERVSERVVKVVEADSCGQYPFLYLVEGSDKVVVIDTGTGGESFKDWIDSHGNAENKPYLVINTHVHFDHTGGNRHFVEAGKPSVIDIAMGAADRTFTENSDITSLCMAHSIAAPVLGVSRWLDNGELVYLDDANPSPDNALEILFTPGHTKDSIALYLRPEGRLFVGDNLYPYTPVHLDCIGSSMADFRATLRTLIEFVDAREAERRAAGTLPPIPTGDGGAEVAPAAEGSTTLVVEPAGSPEDAVAEPTGNGGMAAQRAAVIEGFLGVVGLDRATADALFSVETLMALADWLPANAINMYLSDPEGVMAMAPPSVDAPAVAAAAGSGSGGGSGIAAGSPGSAMFPGGAEADPLAVTLSCGHVEANLPSSALADVEAFMAAVASGAVAPSYRDGAYAEYSSGTFTFMIPDSFLER